MGTNDGVYAKCPYFKENSSKEQRQLGNIRCEGVSDDNNIHLVFGSSKKKREYKVKYCFDLEGCKKCPIHKMIDAKYADT